MINLVNILVSALAVAVAARLMPGVAVGDLLTALIVAITLGVLNGLIAPAARAAEIPLSMLTLALISLLAAGLAAAGLSHALPGFHIAGLPRAFLFGFVLSAVNSVFHFLRRL